MWSCSHCQGVKPPLWALAGKGETEKDTGLAQAGGHASQLGAWECQQLVGVGGGGEPGQEGQVAFTRGWSLPLLCLLRW